MDGPPDCVVHVHKIQTFQMVQIFRTNLYSCLLYTSDAADE